MQCPHCASALRVVEPVPASFVGAHLRLVCPVPSCRHEIFAAVRPAAVPALVALADEEARRYARQRVARAHASDSWLVGGTSAVTVASGALFAAIYAGEDRLFFVGVVVAAALGVVLVLVGGLALDRMLGAAAWLEGLPRPLLNVQPPPETYR